MNVRYLPAEIVRARHTLTLPIRIGVTAARGMPSVSADVAGIAASILPPDADASAIFRVAPFKLTGPARTTADTDVPIVIADAAALRDPLVAVDELRAGKALDRARTRLMILRYRIGAPFGREAAARLGEAYVRAGLPAYLAIGSEDETEFEEYLRSLFADVAHDEPLERIVQPDRRDLETLLIAHRGTEELLSLRPMVHELEANIVQGLDDVSKRRQLFDQNRSRFHVAQAREISERLEAYAVPLARNIEVVRKIRERQWLREGDGIVPLAEAHDEVAAAAPPDVKKELAAAPRVLNAAFTANGVDVDAVTAGTEAALLVQIGPRWTLRTSVVSGSSAFPEEALADGSSGHVLDVVLVSADIEPSIVEAQLWLPKSGASAPYSAGTAGAEGPVSLPFRATASAPARIDGRLTLYYANTVLQSACVACDVVVAGGAQSPPQIRVDYAVTGSLSNVGAFEVRELRNGKGQTERLNVGLTLLLNEDTKGHRIIAKGSSLPAAWRPYAPEANTPALKNARASLLECLKTGPEKSRAIFEDDLDRLARLGASLKVKAFQPLAAGFGGDSDGLLTYLRSLAKVMRSKMVIQVAYSGSTEYVFPWGLVYDYPLDRVFERRYCEVVKDKPLPWTDAPADRCPFDDAEWHRKNILCPYGFWGLRHIIEQPLSALPPKATDDVLSWGERKTPTARPAPIAFTIGVTRDPAITAAVDEHLERVAKLGGVMPAGGADSWSIVEDNLRNADLLYFLCHGQYDASKLEPYLGIGKTGAMAPERIYPSNLFDWALLEENTPPALQHNPLVVINGCHTADLTADDVVSFVGTLSSIGASGVIGTEVSVPVDFATTFALSFLERLTNKQQVGQAMYETRWDFARRGNLSGLAYTPYCFADLAVVT